jgi:hypothetical protein
MNQVSNISIKVTELNSRLNRVYDSLRKKEEGSRMPKFAELWDLKEMAMLQAREEVVIPGGWLQELEHPDMLRVED